MKNTELHTHSHYSDGQISPRELVRLAAKRGIKNLALTDHNTVKGVREAIAEGKKSGVRIIPGVEIRVNEGEILGYFIDIKNKKLTDELKEIGRQNQERVKDYCEKLKARGYAVSFAEIWKKYPKARGNINEFYPMYTLHLNGYGKTMAISKRIRKEKIKKKKKRNISAAKAVNLIKKSGGVPVLAHPWIDEAVLVEKDFKKLVKSGLKGIEINNGDRAPFRNKKFTPRIKRLAKRYNLIITSGSDYHGSKLVKMMPGNHDLGKNNCDEKVVERLWLARD